MRFRVVVFMAMVAVGQRAAAQPQYMSATSYSLAAPIGDTRDFVGNPSWVGLDWEARWAWRRHTSVGFLLGWTEFYKRESGTSDFPSGSATGEQYRHLLTIPALATIHWYAPNGDQRVWFAGVGAGAMYGEQMFELGIDRVTRHSWHFVAMPEVGTALRIDDGLMALVSLRYSLPLSAGNYIGGGGRSFQQLALRIGLGNR